MENKRWALQLLKSGLLSQYEIAKLVGTSQTTICLLNWELQDKKDFLNLRSPKLKPREVLRKEDLEEYEKNQKEKKQWRVGKRKLRDIKLWLRQNAPCR